MKKSVFIDAVCAELRKIGIGDDIIENQRTKMDVYLTSLDIGEESEELDDEDPRDFAEEIFDALVSAGIVENDVPWQDDDFEEEVDDVKQFVTVSDFEEEVHSYTPPNIGDYGDEGATLEFSAVYENTAEYENIYGSSPDGYAEEEYTRPQEREDFIDIALKKERPLSKKAGNPTPFWIAFGLLSPLILALSVAFFTLCGAAYASLALFMVLHIPMIVIAIGGGSLLALSEIIYVIVQLVGGHKTVAFFETGVTIALVGIIILIAVGFKYLGKRSPRGFYYLTKIIKFSIHKIKRGFVFLKGVCSI